MSMKSNPHKGIPVRMRFVREKTTTNEDGEILVHYEIENAEEVRKLQRQAIAEYAGKLNQSVEDLSKEEIATAIQANPELQLYNQANACRPSLWAGLRPFRLWVAIEQMKVRNPALSVNGACAKLAGTGEWAGLDAGSLRSAYVRYTPSNTAVVTAKRLVSEFGLGRVLETFRHNPSKSQK